jgi:long-chain acyl-CoA synthetase
MNLPQLAEQSAERLGERTTLDFEGEKSTNWQTLERARRLQRAFTSLGLKRGDIAALCMVNHPVIYPIFGGIFRTGATAVPCMFQLTAPELNYVLADTKAVGVFTDTQLLPKVREAVAGLSHIRWIAVLGGQENPNANPPEIAVDSLLESDPQTSLPQIDDHDVALMLYTSGTTGKPKGVMLTHANLIASAEASADASELHLWSERRISASAMPMAHIYGIGVMNSGFMVPEHLADSYTAQMKWFEPEKFMACIQQHKCNVMASVPTMLSLILNHPKNSEYDLSSLKEAICGAAPLPVELARAFMNRYGCRVREIYGMTENAGIGSANRMSRPYKPGSAGQPYCNTEVRIMDEEGNLVGPGVRGEIVTRGATTMKGYHNRPDATADTLREGWLHTGDVGYLDDEGWLFIVDRKKDMIIRGGENIYPAELEDAIYKHPSVAEAAVVGAPDPVYGEKVVAYVVPRRGAELTSEELISHVTKHVTPFKAPGLVHFIDALPKSGVGKILRRELRDRAAQDEQLRALASCQKGSA